MSTKVRRFDLFDASVLKPAEKLANGWLRVSGKIARVGIQEYADATGRIRRELREPPQVFDDKAMDSFALVPLTNTHPTTLLDAQTARLHSVGSVSRPVREGDWLVADMLITDAAAVVAAQTGRNELSCGYEAELDETPGVHPMFGHYDCRQLNIRGNHLALVDEARAGHEAKLRLDASDGVMLRSTKSSTRTEQPMPEKIVIDGKRIELTDGNAVTLQAAYDAIKEKLDNAIRGKRAADLVALKFKLRVDCDATDADEEPEEDPDVDCPQCDGSGKMHVAGAADKMVGCDMCDGKGKVKSSSLGEFGGKVKDGDGDGDDDDYADLKKDVDELEAEQETEKEAGASHKDWKSRRDARRARRRKDASKRRKDAAEHFVKTVRARVDHAVRDRAALEVEARGVLGADADIAKLDAAGVKKAVIAKAFPELKLDGKGTEAIEERYQMALEQATAPATGHADDARGDLRAPRRMAPNAAGGPPSRQRVEAARLAREQKLDSVPFGRQKSAEHVAVKK